jgi:CRISPR-associated protein Cas1
VSVLAPGGVAGSTLKVRVEYQVPNTATARLAEVIEQVDRVRAIKSLLGSEGIGAAIYFQVFKHLFKDGRWRFDKRVRRPPTDPVNVLLSFGYTMLTHNLVAAVERVGLDPYLGCLHADSYNRPSLALDLVEEFRCIVVDSVTLRCLNGNLITPENFSRQDDPHRPILLDEAGRSCFIRAFEARLVRTFTHPVTREKVTYRRCFDLQAREMARAFQSGTPYRPFTVR